MEVVDLKQYNCTIENPVDNLYETKPKSISQPCLMMVVGVRNSGKSYTMSQLLKDDHDCFDRIYMITPSFKSNAAYFEKYVNEEDVYKPSKDAVNKVVSQVELDKEEWELHLEKLRVYSEFMKACKDNKFNYSDDDLLALYDMDLLNGSPPVWKYHRKGKEDEPPRSFLIMDDCLGSKALLQSSGVTTISTLNRHIAPLEENWVSKKTGRVRSACGLGVAILTQTYSMRDGISRVVRENLTDLLVYQNKQEGQMNKLKEELCSVVDEELFSEAYNKATSKKYGCLCISFKPKCASLTFRQNLSKAITFPQLPCTCNGEVCKK